MLNEIIINGKKYLEQLNVHYNVIYNENYLKLKIKPNFKEDEDERIYIISRVKNELIPPKRNYLWSLAMSLELTLDEADELFSSCGLCMASQYHLTDMEKEREGIIKDCIAKGKYSVVELNIRLYEAGYQILGNKGAN